MFGAVSLTKHVDIDQYKNFGYSIGFDREGEFSFGNGFGRNVKILGADMSSSVHASNKTKNILVLGKDFVQGLDNTAIYAEILYSVSFTQTNTKFCLGLHYNEPNRYLFVNGTEIHKFKANASEIVATPLCLGNISKDFSVDNLKKTRLNWYIYDFFVDYDAIAVDDRLDIHKYLMEKNIKSCLDLLKNVFFHSNNFFSYNLLNVNSLECFSMNNQECKTRTKIVNTNNNEPVFYPFSIKVNNCSGNFNDINDPYAKLCSRCY